MVAEHHPRVVRYRGHRNRERGHIFGDDDPSFFGRCAQYRRVGSTAQVVARDHRHRIDPRFREPSGQPTRIVLVEQEPHDRSRAPRSALLQKLATLPRLKGLVLGGVMTLDDLVDLAPVVGPIRQRGLYLGEREAKRVGDRRGVSISGRV